VALTMTSTTLTGRTAEDSTTPNRTRAISWWAGLGFAFLAFAAYLVISWIAAGEPARVPPGPTPLPAYMKVSLTIQQWGLFAGMLALIWFKAIRPRLRTGTVPFDGLMVLSFALMWWSDPFYNYFTPGFNYNAYFINLGSWVGHAPGWMSPNPTQIAQPLIFAVQSAATVAMAARGLRPSVVLGHSVGEVAAAAAAGIYGARAVKVAADGTVYILERQGSTLRAVDPNSGIITTLAGTGERAYGGDDGPALAASFDAPKELAIDREGNLLIVDTENHAIRRVDIRTGTVATIAGSGRQGGDGDGGPARAAALDRPHGAAVAADGSIYVGNTNNHRIRKLARA